MKSPIGKCLSLALLMIAASGAALALKPTKRLGELNQSLDLERAIPRQFGEWGVDERVVASVVNPQANTLINRIYSQTLSRTYVSARTGERIMLSIAYGSEQSDARRLHLPDVCYPAQGFQVLSNERGVLETDAGDIPVKRLTTVLGDRTEPLTYWATVGNKVALGDFDAKLAQLSYGFRGEIPDGLIIRVSSISSEVKSAFGRQQGFVTQFIHAIPAGSLTRFTGLKDRKPATGNE